MPDIVPLDEFVTGDWYPGYRPEYGSGAFVNEPFSAFRPEDVRRFWFLDFHTPRGFTPMGFVVLEDCYTWGTQWGAEHLPLPTGGGLAARVAGTHVYCSTVPVDAPWEINMRAERMGRSLPASLAAFHDAWQERLVELEAGNSHFASIEFMNSSTEELHEHLISARRFHRRCWEIHFETMYPLLANYLGFYGVCQEFNIDPAHISKFLQGFDTKIMACDRTLGQLTRRAREAGLENVFASHEPEELSNALVAAGEQSAAWRSDFEAFLTEFGWRTDVISDIMEAPWIDDPTTPLGTIKTYLSKPVDHDYDWARRAADEEREAAIDSARSRLTSEEQRVFDDALASCQAANFAWWNEEHNHYIDLRAIIPLRRTCVAIGRHLGCDEPDDTLFLFWPELVSVVRGQRQWRQFKGVVTERRDYYRHWLERRPEMPKILGTVPDQVHDPLMIEIFGLHHQFLEAVRSDTARTELRGMPASGGKAQGPARVLHDATELHRIQPGEVLVCEATSPNWTPAFAKIAACVCDAGGMLTHASTVSREYRVPCVVGVGVATSAIRDGDLVDVDGDTGTVRVAKG